MPEPTLEIKDGQDYAIRNQTSEEIEQIANDDTPSYQIDLDLTEDQEEELIKQVFLEVDAIKTEHTTLNLSDKWSEKDRQYDGILKDNKNLTFNLHVQESKIKTDAIVRAINEAFIDSDPMFDVTPRPEQARQNGFEIAEKQAEFLDFAVDEEIQPEHALTMIGYSAVKKFVGIGKLCWDYQKERRRREETYDGGDIEILGYAANGEPIVKNNGLQRFLQAYPDAPKTYPNYVKRLMEGKKINIVVEFEDTVCNNPKVEYVKIENFLVRNACRGNEGLRTEHCIAERQSYSYWELKEKEKDGDFKDVDKLFISDEGTVSEKAKVEEYDVLEVTTYFKVKDSDDEIKIKAWFGEEKKVYLGGIVYPYYGFDTDYIAFYIKLNDYGFYGDCRSVLDDLKDTNLAQDSLLNLTLDGMYKRNTVTPICREGSEIEEMFMDHKFETGKPLPVDELTDDVSRAIGFVQYPSMDTNGALVWMEKLKRIGSDVSKVSDLTTGGESAIDPSAPASKTIALLEQSGIGIKDYIRTFLPSFNHLAMMILQLYYQMSQNDKEYKVIGKSKAVTGDNPFSTLTREEMAVKTNIQSRAASFAFDKMNEKREAMAAYQIVNADPYAMQQPELRYKALSVLLDTFGSRWKTISDNSLLSPEDFRKQQEQVALMAIQKLFQMAQQQAQTTGVAPNEGEILQQAPDAVTQAQAVSYDPSLAEEDKK